MIIQTCIPSALVTWSRHHLFTQGVFRTGQNSPLAEHFSQRECDGCGVWYCKDRTPQSKERTGGVLRNTKLDQQSILFPLRYLPRYKGSEKIFVLIILFRRLPHTSSPPWRSCKRLGYLERQGTNIERLKWMDPGTLTTTEALSTSIWFPKHLQYLQYHCRL